MKVQVNTDASIEGHDALVTRVSGMVEQALGRFRDHITRVEAHLSDVNAGKGGQDDKRCLLEVRLQGRQPEAVSEQAATMAQAVQGACDKLVRMLDSTLGRLNEHRAHRAPSSSPDAPATSD
jgi:ribosome-associated translation inhibitor RaiA